MVSEAINAPLDVGRTFSEKVWYSSNVALGEGEGVCYNWDYGTDTALERSRYNRVETPTTLNAQHFAGVAARAYSAVSTGQFIEIYKPGSVCNVLCGKDTDTVVGVGLLTFDVTSGFKGEFRYAGLTGAGSAQPLQTTTGDTSNPGLCLALLLEGQQSGGVEVAAFAATGAIGTLMIGGTTFVPGGAIASGNNTYTLAVATTIGLRKKFGILADITGYSWTITVTNGITLVAAMTALATATYSAGGDHDGASFAVQWNEGAWNLIASNAKAGLA